MTENIKPCGRKPGWDWKGGDKLMDDSTGLIINRNYFDCGTYFFDGEFNVVKFPKNMILYHGSGILADNLTGFPVGIPYYNPKTADFKVPSSIIAAHSDESIEAIITENFPITAGWYADPETAKIYSTQNLDGICKDMCVYAYKVVKDIVLFLLDDDYNLGKLIKTTNEKLIPKNVKESLHKMFNLGDLRQTSTRFNTVAFSKKDRRSDRYNDMIFSNWACDSLIKRYNYSGYAANQLISSHLGGVFHLEFVFCNTFKWLERDTKNKHDWQYNPILEIDKNLPHMIKTYYEQLDLYECTNINFHAGNLLEHSVWTLLWAEYLLDGVDKFEFLQVDNNFEFKKVIAFTAFIHDIGKIEPEKHREHNIYNEKRNKYIYYNIPKHSQYGYDYIIGNQQFPLYKDNKVYGNMEIDTMLKDFGINVRFKNFIAGIILLHWDFGSILKIYNSNTKKVQEMLTEYLSKAYNIIKPTNAKNFKIFIIGLITVSISDILATQPYGIKRITTIRPTSPDTVNKRSKYFPYISNITKNYKGINLLEISNLLTKGVELSTLCINNAEVFYEKFNQLPQS